MTRNKMPLAMGGINDSAEDIERDLKTIKEAAFQTHLLALKAALLALRAALLALKAGAEAAGQTPANKQAQGMDSTAVSPSHIDKEPLSAALRRFWADGRTVFRHGQPGRRNPLRPVKRQTDRLLH
jgi:hypothetical protein